MFKENNKHGKGRPKGSTNALTSEIREAFTNLVNNNLQTVDEDLRLMKPNERVKVIIELAKFILPTLKAVEQNNINLEQPLFPDVFSLYQMSDADIEAEFKKRNNE